MRKLLNMFAYRSAFMRPTRKQIGRKRELCLKTKYDARVFYKFISTFIRLLTITVRNKAITNDFNSK